MHVNCFKILHSLFMLYVYHSNSNVLIFFHHHCEKCTRDSVIFTNFLNFKALFPPKCFMEHQSYGIFDDTGVILGNTSEKHHRPQALLDNQLLDISLILTPFFPPNLHDHRSLSHLTSVNIQRNEYSKTYTLGKTVLEVSS